MTFAPATSALPGPNVRPRTNRTTHNMRFSSEYGAWARMKDRCNNPNLPGWENYGGRGITYEPAWEDFEAFYRDMGNCPPGLTLDRQDNNKGYCKNNCRWADRRVQALNRRPFKNNTTGISGITERTPGIWRVRVYTNFVRETIYQGSDFLEACCARKSWENHHGL